MIWVKHLDELCRVRADLVTASLVLARELTDTGRRTELDDANAEFGFDRAGLERGLDADIAAGRGDTASRVSVGDAQGRAAGATTPAHPARCTNRVMT